MTDITREIKIEERHENEEWSRSHDRYDNYRIEVKSDGTVQVWKNGIGYGTTLKDLIEVWIEEEDQ